MVTQSGRVSGAPSAFADDVLEVVDTIPEGVMRPMELAALFVNHRFPSGPAVMSFGANRW